MKQAELALDITRLDIEFRPASEYKQMDEQDLTRLCFEKYEEECRRDEKEAPPPVRVITGDGAYQVRQRKDSLRGGEFLFRRYLAAAGGEVVDEVREAVEVRPPIPRAGRVEAEQVGGPANEPLSSLLAPAEGRNDGQERGIAIREPEAGVLRPVRGLLRLGESFGRRIVLVSCKRKKEEEEAKRVMSISQSNQNESAFNGITIAWPINSNSKDHISHQPQTISPLRISKGSPSFTIFATITMFSPTDMPQSVSTLFSAYAAFAGSLMLIRSMVNELIPYELRSYLSTAIHYLFTPLSPNITLVIDEHCGMSRNQVYDAAEIYLKTKISPSTERLKIGKTPRQRTFSVAIEKGEVVTDVYENIKLKWAFVCTEPQNNSHSGEKKRFELYFNKKYKEKVMDRYLPHVLKRGKEIKDEEKVVKLYNRECPFNDEDGGDHGGMWGSINLEHPSTFDTLALDPELKKMIVDDLKRFLGRKEFYKKVGKAWKRGYLLYGPPGTGKSSLIAAMANYLKFDIYDLELTSIYSNSDLRRVLLSTTNRSILVIEDIDCSMEMRDRQQGGDQYDGSNSRLTLSGLLNFIDGLWSSCGDERIIVFTTNHKDRLDSALLRPGRMDVHINMSYCTPQAFSILASNYLGIRDKNHYLYDEIEGLMESTNVTPAEVAEELMASENADVALEGLVNFLKRKHGEANEVKSEENGKVGDEEAKRLKTDVDEKKIVNKFINRNRILRAARGVRRRNCGRRMIPQNFFGI
ncbi:hypothetical protein POTOM_027944 [Populus tomentosa]|uniref:AAA+ ATPase domain-containing protein n=1 Tax=Populus tomentosa TaxID=118781 RepID=A0A8X7ZCI9_POPTO|nr:hypothetical protein POTOM_027944 [Populus tomentosa]